MCSIKQILNENQAKPFGIFFFHCKNKTKFSEKRNALLLWWRSQPNKQYTQHTHAYIHILHYTHTRIHTNGMSMSDAYTIWYPNAERSLYHTTIHLFLSHTDTPPIHMYARPSVSDFKNLKRIVYEAYTFKISQSVAHTNNHNKIILFFSFIYFRLKC